MPIYEDFGGNLYQAAAALSVTDQLVVSPSTALVTALTAVTPTPKRVTVDRNGVITLSTATYDTGGLIARYTTDASGNITGLVGAGGSFLFSGSATCSVAATSSVLNGAGTLPNTFTATANAGVTSLVVAIQGATSAAQTTWVTLGTIVLTAAGSASFSALLPYYGYRANVITLVGGTCSIALAAGQQVPTSSSAYVNPVNTGIPANAPFIVAQSAVAVINPSSGSVTGSGTDATITLNAAMYQIYADGCWMVLPAGAAYAGSLAGLYWCVMSSTTVGILYDITLGTSQVPYVPSSPPRITASRGATGYTTLLVSPAQIFGGLIPGGLMGVSGALRVRANFGFSGGSTSGTVCFGVLGATGTQMHSNASAAAANAGYDFMIRNLGVANRQRVSPLVNYVDTGSYATAPQQFSIDTTAAQYITLQPYTGNVAQWSSLEGFTVEVLPS
jgi:hypothetical protein